MRYDLRQADIDEVRVRICATLLVEHVKRWIKTRDKAWLKVPVQHIRFPKDSPNAYELRTGNPPSNTDRHPWERFMRIEIDLGEIDIVLARRAESFIHKSLIEADRTPKAKIDDIIQIAYEVVKRSGAKIDVPEPRPYKSIDEQEADQATNIHDQREELFRRSKKRRGVITW